jgi:hypothetical protein
VEAPAAAGGVEDAVLVALAYERTGGCAGTAPDCGVDEPDVVDAEVCWAEGEAALVMGGMDGECRARTRVRAAPKVETVRRSYGMRKRV